MKIKKVLYLSHRWLGISVCLLIAVWFATGIVMMYVGYPSLTEQERYAGLAVLDSEKIHYSPLTLIENLSPNTPLEHLKLTSVANRPVYLLKFKGYPWQGMYSDSGEIFTQFPAELAVTSANYFYQSQYSDQKVEAKYQRTLEMDQWTISSGLSQHRPLHWVTMNDHAKTHLYVSSRTGEVVQDTTRRERIWNWLGANLHWIYPLQLRKHTNLWANVIIALSLIGLITVITGSIIGVIRLRVRRRYRSGSVTPYQGIPKCHHLLGLVSVSFLFTFLFSGLMSMNPWGLFDARSNLVQQIHRYQMGNMLVRSAPAYVELGDIEDLLKKYQGDAIKEIIWHWIGGESHLTVHDSEQRPRYRFAGQKDETLEQKIYSHVSRLIPDKKIVAMERIEEYDSYYYSHHERLRPLPVLRLKFSDSESTWFHVDLSTGQVLERLTYKNRWQRWLFNGLHSLDFTALINRRPAWDFLLLSLCAFGLIFSVTSVVIGWRRFRKHVRPTSKKF